MPYLRVCAHAAASIIPHENGEETVTLYESRPVRAIQCICGRQDVCFIHETDHSLIYVSHKLGEASFFSSGKWVILACVTHLQISLIAPNWWRSLLCAHRRNYGTDLFTQLLCHNCYCLWNSAPGSGGDTTDTRSCQRLWSPQEVTLYRAEWISMHLIAFTQQSTPLSLIEQQNNTAAESLLCSVCCW